MYRLKREPSAAQPGAQKPRAPLGFARGTEKTERFGRDDNGDGVKGVGTAAGMTELIGTKGPETRVGMAGRVFLGKRRGLPGAAGELEGFGDREEKFFVEWVADELNANREAVSGS